MFFGPPWRRRRFAASNAATHDGARLPDVLNKTKTNMASQVFAKRAKGFVKRSLMEWRTEGGTAYRSKANEVHMERNGFVSKVHFRRSKGVSLTASQAKANAARSKVRSAVETVFAVVRLRRDRLQMGS